MKLNKFVWLRNITAFCLMLTVFAATSLVVSAAPDKNVSMGELVVSGTFVDGNEPVVMLNGEKAYNGRTFFSSGTIVTDENTNATIKLGKLGYINVAPNSALSVNFDDHSITGTLSTGDIKVVNAEGVDVKITTINDIVTNDAQANSVLNINAAGLPAQDDDDSTISSGSAAIPVIVLAGIVTAAVVYVVTQGDNNDNAFVSGTF